MEKGYSMQEVYDGLKEVKRIVTNCGACLNAKEYASIEAAIYFIGNMNNLQRMLYDPANMDKILFDFDHTWCPYDGEILFLEEAQEKGCNNCPFCDSNDICYSWADPRSSRQYWERKIVHD